jgi:hypothetical protein
MVCAGAIRKKNINNTVRTIDMNMTHSHRALSLNVLSVHTDDQKLAGREWSRSRLFRLWFRIFFRFVIVREILLVYRRRQFLLEGQR